MKTFPIIHIFYLDFNQINDKSIKSLSINRKQPPIQNSEDWETCFIFIIQLMSSAVIMNNMWLIKEMTSQSRVSE